MQYSSSIEKLSNILQKSISPSSLEWLSMQIESIVSERSTKKLYLTYTLCGAKIEKANIDFGGFKNDDIVKYLEVKKANTLEVARILLLIKVLDTDQGYFKDKVLNLIQIADTQELITFLNYLVLLPNPEDFIFVAVEALRTNISTVFEAIAMDNPYPSKYFNEQQWNQMYLKAAFIQGDLSRIVGVDKMGNQDLTRIISDYAHERWAASRTIDPEFWRPTSGFIEGVLVDDMKRLFKSDNPLESKAAALVCFYSNKTEARELLNEHLKLKELVLNNTLTWDSLKN